MKSTGKFFPFYVTAIDVRCSEDVPDCYHLYRVFEFAGSPRPYLLSGSLREICLLKPIQFLAGAHAGAPE